MPAISLKITEKIVGQSQPHVFELRLVSERISDRDIITRHVTEQVQAENARRKAARADQTQATSFLVGIPQHPAEQRLNTLKPLKLLDPAAETKAALAAFEARQVIMLFDNYQIEQLEVDLTVMPKSEALFLRLVPLVGG